MSPTHESPSFQERFSPALLGPQSASGLGLKIPTAVIIDYDAKLRPSSVVCGYCGEQLLNGYPLLISPDRAPEWIAAQFELHVIRRHRSQRPPKQPEIDSGDSGD